MTSTSQRSARHRGVVSERETKSTKLHQFRRNTISVGMSNGIDSFKEMTQDIALHKSDKLFSYNMSKSVGEENPRCSPNQKSQLKGRMKEKCVCCKEKGLHSTNCRVLSHLSLKEKQQTFSASENKGFSTKFTDDIDLPEKGVFRQREWAHVKRWKQVTKCLSSSVTDSRTPREERKSIDCSVKRCDKCQKLCNHKTREYSKGQRKLRESKQNDSNEAVPDIRNVICKEHNGVFPNMKMCNSESNFDFHLESQSRVHIKRSHDEYAHYEKTALQLSPPTIEIGQVKHAGSTGSLVSTSCSHSSSGSRKSSISQRSVVSVTSSTSISSLAEKIVEARSLLRTRDIIREQKSGSVDSADSLPSSFTSKRPSVNSDESFVMYSKQSGLAASVPNLISNFQIDQEDGNRCLQQCDTYLTGSRKHLPDVTPEEGENSSPIKPVRKYFRRVFEA